MHEKPTANIIFNCETKCCSPKLKNKAKMSAVVISIQYLLEGHTKTVSQGKEIEGSRLETEDQNYLFSDDFFFKWKKS